jgi:uncharacterized iron-regulated membrane protein
MIRRIGSLLRNLIQWIHLWTTFLVGIFLVVVVLSGTLLMFRPELEPLFYSNLYRVSPGASLGLNRALQSVEKAYPNSAYEIRQIELPAMTHGAYRFQMNGLSGGSNGEVFVDPTTAKVNGFMPEDSSIFAWLLLVHRKLLIPNDFPQTQSYQGYWVVGMIGLVFLLMLLTGLVLWFPKINQWRHAFALRRKNAFIWNYDIHKLIGILTLLPLIAITAIILPKSFWTQADDALKILNWERGKPEQVFAFPGDGAPRLLEQLIQTAEATTPGARAVKIKVADPTQITINAGYDPSRGSGRYEGNVIVYLDRFTGKVLGQTDTRKWSLQAQVVDSPMNMAVHAGTWGGIFTRLLEFVISLATVYMAWTGVRQWWLKRVKRIAQRRNSRLKNRALKA